MPEYAAVEMSPRVPAMWGISDRTQIRRKMDSWNRKLPRLLPLIASRAKMAKATRMRTRLIVSNNEVMSSSANYLTPTLE